jgi:hypothetical protein
MAYEKQARRPRAPPHKASTARARCSLTQHACAVAVRSASPDAIIDIISIYQKSAS